MMIAVFVPEWVLYCAFDQWSTARKLKNEINKLAEMAIAGDASVLVCQGLRRQFLRPLDQSSDSEEGRFEAGADHR